MANNNESVILNVDIKKAEVAIVDIAKGINSLNELVKEIGSTITNTFVSLQNCLQGIENGILDITSALEGITSVIEDFSMILENTSSTDHLAQEIQETIDGVLMAIGTIAGVVAALATMGVAAPELAVVAVIMAVVAVIVGAITEIIEHWDELSQMFTVFFTETLPQLWSKLSRVLAALAETLPEPFRGVAMEIVGLFSDCWYSVVDLWEGATQWFVNHVIQPINDFISPMITWINNLTGSIQKVCEDVFYNIGASIDGCKAIIEQIIITLCSSAVEWIKDVREKVRNLFENTAEFFGGIVSAAWEKIVEAFSLDGTPFGNLKEGILSAFKKLINGMISGINAVIKTPFEGLNISIIKLKSAEIFGITPFANLRTVTIPQIPYLAQGAVLPANRPFLAVVGDQKHGTNVEAPLATIQQAVSVAMDSRMAAMMEIFRELLNEQRATRQSVESIHIGDDMLARAVDRYNRKMAVVYGTGRI